MEPYAEEHSQITEKVICKIIETQSAKPLGSEPGVEMAKGLSSVINATIREAVHSGHDLADIAKGIFIGAFRRDLSFSLEAHKTIRLLIQEIIQSVFRYKGDMNKAVRGILCGVPAIAMEHKLNTQEATLISKEDIRYAFDKIGIQSKGKV